MHLGGCKWCNIELITIQDCGIFPDELPNQEVFFAFKNILVTLMLHGSTPGINIRWGWGGRTLNHLEDTVMNLYYAKLMCVPFGWPKM